MTISTLMCVCLTPVSFHVCLVVFGGQHIVVIRGTAAQHTHLITAECLHQSLQLDSKYVTDVGFLTLSLLCVYFQRKALYTEAQMRMTTTDLGPQTQRLQTGPTAVRRAALLCPVMETEIWASTASRTPAETPRALEEALQARSPMSRPMGVRASPRGSALARTPSRGSPEGPGLPSPMSSWWRWKTSSSPRATYRCVSGSTWPCRSPSLRPRSRSGSRTAGPSGRSRIPEPTPPPPPAQEEREALEQEVREEQEAWGASALSVRPLRWAGTWPCMLATAATITLLQAAWSSCLSSPPATSCPPSCWGHRATLHPPSTAHTCRHTHTHLEDTPSETHCEPRETEMFECVNELQHSRQTVSVQLCTPFYYQHLKALISADYFDRMWIFTTNCT